MAHQVMVRSAYYCGCGYGQKGDLHGRNPDGSFPLEARGWDGKTFVDHVEGEDPVCPNLVNHASAQQAADRDRLAALEAEVASLRGRVEPKPGSSKSDAGADAGYHF